MFFQIKSCCLQWQFPRVQWVSLWSIKPVSRSPKPILFGHADWKLASPCRLIYRIGSWQNFYWPLPIRQPKRLLSQRRMECPLWRLPSPNFNAFQLASFGFWASCPINKFEAPIFLYVSDTSAAKAVACLAGTVAGLTQLSQEKALMYNGSYKLQACSIYVKSPFIARCEI